LQSISNRSTSKPRGAMPTCDQSLPPRHGRVATRGERAGCKLYVWGERNSFTLASDVSLLSIVSVYFIPPVHTPHPILREVSWP
jgi:hypothetical protein